MISSSSSRSNAFAIVAVVFLLLTTGFSRELMRSTTTVVDSFAPSPSPFEEDGGITREMIELDYADAGPNTNKRSGFTLPSPDPVAPAPQP